jgi:transposase-like protein
MNHCSTPEQRIEWMMDLLRSPSCHGLITQYSRDHQVSRQSLYRWKQKAQQALKDVFTCRKEPDEQRSHLHREVLTLLMEAHASYRQIQTCLAKMLGISLSVGSICSIVQLAGERARAWLSRQRSTTARALALDEQFSSQRGEAYLNVVDVHSGQVWASLPPATVEGESWMIVLWDLQAQGVAYETTVSDGGHAIHEALKHLNQLQMHQRDVWHVFQQAAKVQGRLETLVSHEEERLRTITRYEQRQAQGERITGRPPKTSGEEQRQVVGHLMHVWEAVAYLFRELHRLLDVMLLEREPEAGLMPVSRRQVELETLVHLLFEVVPQAPTSVQHDLQGLARLLQLALPSLLHFAHQLEEKHHQAVQTLGGEAVHLMAWAWQRRNILGPDLETLVQGFAPAWRPIAHQLFESWNQAVRASSVVENWHSIVRPHLAVHRTLSAGMLALLAVWHNHRIAPRGLHADLSPLQRSQADHVEADWLTALGFLPVAA